MIRAGARALTALLLTGMLAAPLGAQEAVDLTGDIDGSPYRIQVPVNWNGNLVMYAHGYLVSGRAWKPMPDVYAKVFLDRGFAVGESGYSRQGWAVEQALEETEAVRMYFVKTQGKPDSTFITGFSMGGFLSMATIEKYPGAYDGALPMCGPLVPALAFFTRAFDMLVTFEALFGEHMAPEYLPVVEAEAVPGPAFAQALAADSAMAVRYCEHWGVKDAEMAGNLGFFHLFYREMVGRAGGNPIDNRNTVYTGFGWVPALNASVPRYAADKKAVDYLIKYYTPTGRLEDPVVAVHTTYDPGVPPHLPSSYTVTTELAGSGDKFVQYYVEADGHCNIAPELVGKAFDELRRWLSEGVRPDGGALE